MPEWITWPREDSTASAAHKVKFTTDHRARTRCGLNVALGRMSDAPSSLRKCAVCVTRSGYIPRPRPAPGTQSPSMWSKLDRVDTEEL